MQILITVVIIQFVVILWLAYPRIKQHIEDRRSGTRFDSE